jgi:arginine utilization regulatory protein
MPTKSIVGSNAAFTRALNIVDLSADSPSPALIAGETGCGKEMFARLIHDKSSRKNKPFLALNCAAIPATLIESTLFGTVKGSFTGAVDHAGIFEEADGGTVYLDEIDSMPLDLQPKLLRVLQDMSATRLGSNQSKRLNFKLVSSISCSPQTLLDEGRLRSDLFFRLAVIVINLPPLRERPDDLADLITYFLYKYNMILGRQIISLDPDLTRAMRRYHWPGNVRELEHLIAGAMNLVPDDCFTISMDHLAEHHAGVMRELSLEDHGELGLVGPPYGTAPAFRAPQEPAERGPARENFSSAPYSNRRDGQADREVAAISQALTESGGNIAKAARGLGMSRQLLHYKMMKYRLDRHDFKAGPGPQRWAAE